MRLEAITFNHDPTSATTDALNIRRNALSAQSVPEWRRGVSLTPGDSVAAYALSETLGNTLTIQATFSRTGQAAGAVEVRAIHPILPDITGSWLASVRTPALPGAAPVTYYAYSYYFWQLLALSTQNILGEIEPTTVNFDASGDSELVPFQLTNVRIWDYGAGAHTVRWRWQYRQSPAESWTDFAISSHRIYTLLTIPTAPWVQTPFHPANLQLPWSDVLFYSCQWARGTKTTDEAAGAVTESVYNLGPELLEYGCVILGLTQYAAPEGFFNCTAFIDRLRGGIGNGRYLNCTDCATIVSTFSNCLGCDLSQARMGMLAPLFPINPVLPIGSSTWQPACGLPGFFYHEVAWKGACTADDPVFDACIQLDRDTNPSRVPHTPILPTNMRFGQPGDGQYRDRLATPQGRALCEPQPITRQRRPVF
jgi:hypothetical protein